MRYSTSQTVKTCVMFGGNLRRKIHIENISNCIAWPCNEIHHTGYVTVNAHRSRGSNLHVDHLADLHCKVPSLFMRHRIESTAITCMLHSNSWVNLLIPYMRAQCVCGVCILYCSDVQLAALSRHSNRFEIFHFSQPYGHQSRKIIIFRMKNI